MTDRLTGLSLDIEQAERDKLRAVFPQCFVSGKVICCRYKGEEGVKLYG